MADALEVAPEIAFHLDGHAVLEQVFLLQQELLGQGADTLLGVLAVGCTPEIQIRVDEAVLAFGAFTGRVVLEELDVGTTFGARNLINGTGLPI
jgi:hypothetical protein